MKHAIYFIVIAIMLSSCLGEDQKGSVRVMSFNIRYDNPDDGINSWENRRNIVINTIIEESPDLMGLQEVLHNQLNALDTLLPWYDYVGVGRDDGAQKGEYTPIFFKMTRLNLENWGTFWLSEFPDSTGSVGWDAALPRTVTWAKFYDKHTQTYFYVLNTHLDHRGIISKTMSTAMIERFVSENTEDLPIILTGDFNFELRNKGYKFLTREEGIFADVLGDTTIRDPGAKGTFNAFRFEEGKSIIDFIFVTEEWKIFEPQIIPVVDEGVYISDHYPVVVNIKLPR